MKRKKIAGKKIARAAIPGRTTGRSTNSRGNCSPAKARRGKRATSRTLSPEEKEAFTHGFMAGLKSWSIVAPVFNKILRTLGLSLDGPDLSDDEEIETEETCPDHEANSKLKVH